MVRGKGHVGQQNVTGAVEERQEVNVGRRWVEAEAHCIAALAGPEMHGIDRDSVMAVLEAKRAAAVERAFQRQLL